MAGEVVSGINCKAYIDPSGVGGSAWSELSKVGPVAMGGSWNKGKLSERGSRHAKEVLGHRETEVTMTITRRPGDTNYDNLRNAYNNGTQVGLAVMTGTITTSGVHGYQANMYVTGWNDNQEPTGTGVEITFSPAAESTTEPSDVVVI